MLKFATNLTADHNLCGGLVLCPRTGLVILIFLSAVVTLFATILVEPVDRTRERLRSDGPSLTELSTFSADNLRPITPADAVILNDKQPLAQLGNPAARPFRGIYSGNEDRLKAVECLTDGIYYEAASESEAGQKAVAQVILNRVSHVGYPNSVCGVVYQGSNRRTGCQFSFTCDGSLSRVPSTLGRARAKAVAIRALAGYVESAVGHSTHYHANYVVPYWSSSLIKTAVIGTHIFYRSPGVAGKASSFHAQYAGVERTSKFSMDIASSDESVVDATPSTFSPQATDLQIADVSELRARELDHSGLLDYKSPKTQSISGKVIDPRIESALSAALGGDERVADPPLP